MRPGECPTIPARKLNLESDQKAMCGLKAYTKDSQSPFKDNKNEKKTEQHNPWGPTFKDRQHFQDMHFN